LPRQKKGKDRGIHNEMEKKRNWKKTPGKRREGVGPAHSSQIFKEDLKTWVAAANYKQNPGTKQTGHLVHWGVEKNPTGRWGPKGSGSYVFCGCFKGGRTPPRKLGLIRVRTPTNLGFVLKKKENGGVRPVDPALVQPSQLEKKAKKKKATEKTLKKVSPLCKGGILQTRKKLGGFFVRNPCATRGKKSKVFVFLKKNSVC